MKHYLTLILATLVLMMSVSLAAQTDCDPNGDGNPYDSANDGGGQGVGADHVFGDIAWQDLEDACDGHYDLPPFGAKNDYDPSDFCNNSSNIIPLAVRTEIRSVRVAIIDSGVRPTKKDRFNNARLFSYKVSSDGIVAEGEDQPHPHGTYSAGVISGLLASQGNEVEHEYYDYQVLNGALRTSLSAVVGAIDHAVSMNVNVISLSIGFLPSACNNTYWESTENPLYAAIDRAGQAGVVVITSAGNDGADLLETPQYPAAYVSLDNLVSVGALECDSEKPTQFSNFGSEVVDLFTTGAFVRVYYDFCWHEIHGTSFATSIVAGKAAIHFAQGESPTQVLSLLRSQVRPFRFGEQFSIYGIVDTETVGEGEGGGSTGLIWQNSGKNNLQDGKTSLVKVGPNPFQQELRLKFGKLSGTTTVSMFDSRGSKVLIRIVKQNELTLDLKELSAGVYWLNIQDDDGNQTMSHPEHEVQRS